MKKGIFYIQLSQWPIVLSNKNKNNLYSGFLDNMTKIFVKIKTLYLVITFSN